MKGKKIFVLFLYLNSMKKLLFSLKVLGALVALAFLFLFLSFQYFNTTFLSFEGEYNQQVDLNKITKEEISFVDRNKNGILDPYEDTRLTVEERVLDVLSRMTLEEKIHLLKGSGIASAMGQTLPGGIKGAVGTIVPTPRLGIPTYYLSDGPAGLRISPRREGEDRTYYCTSFPIASMLASTWDETLLGQIGEAMGEEARDYGIDLILGPGANIHRHPLCGRNFEYYSEDPLLSGFMGASIVNGIQRIGIGTSVKHFVANNQETHRKFNDVIVSERALREIYLKGFEHIVKRAQPWSVMSSYNKVNGTYTSQSKELLTDILRDEWGFEGLVMTDWFGGEDAVAQINAGNDLIEPGTKKQWDALLDANVEGSLEEPIIDRAAARILKAIFQSRKMQAYTPNNTPDLKAHALLTRKAAADGMVLLKNNGTLPLKKEKNIALFGITSYGFIAGGTGSGDVNEAYTVSLEEGLRSAGEVNAALLNEKLKSTDEIYKVALGDGLNNAGYAINSTAKEVYEKHKKANREAFIKPQELDAMFTPYNPPEINYTKEQITAIAKSSDLAIITLGRNSGEVVDRKNSAGDYLLTEVEKSMISDVTEIFHAEGKKVLVVLNVGGVIETASWKDIPDAILLAWQGGQEGGNAVTDILSGKVNPSGKLPMTFPIEISDHASDKNFPKNPIRFSMNEMIFGLMFPPKERPEEEKVINEDYTYYEEGVYVGYRHFDTRNIPVSYPFGYGLSYTEFDYEAVDLTFKNKTLFINTMVKNIGDVSGKEVVQVYVSKQNSTVDRPIQELKAFAKTDDILPNESQTLELQIPLSELAYWNEEAKAWEIENGMYLIKVGSSSRDIRETIAFEVPEKE